MGWSTIIGGAIGAVVGGPLGAAAGAAVGALIDNAENTETILDAPKIDGQFGLANDQDGTFIRFTFPSLPTNTILRVSASEQDRYVRSTHANYADDDGDFCILTLIDNSTHSIYIPKGVFQRQNPSSITLHFSFIQTDGNGENATLLGQNRYTVDIPTGIYIECAQWRPLIYLCTHLGYADGHLDTSEIETLMALLVEELEIPQSELSQVEQMMQQYNQWSLADCIKHYKRRFPEVESFALLKCLSIIDEADGVIHPNEISMIEQVHQLLGLPPSAWQECAQSLGLIPNKSNPALKEYRDLLGVSETATAKEINRAFRKMAAEYHPDKHQNLPPHFQQFATEMMQKLGRAKDELLKVAPS